jgi:hypothetical protein
VQSREQLEKRVAELERQLAAARGLSTARVRHRSGFEIANLPLYDIAFGPDPEHYEPRGHARGIIAIGDMATGVVAVGGFARGVIAIGGFAVGLFSFAGCSIGLLAAFGGFALGSVAIGGASVGAVALGGGAAGYYVCAGAGAGEHVIAQNRGDPEAVEFFSEYGLRSACGPGRYRPRRSY